jgi:transposase
MDKHDLTDAEWRLVEPLLPDKPRGSPRVDDRRVLNGIFHVLRTASAWCDVPERYGPRTTIYNRYNRWAKAGVWLRVFEELEAKAPESMARIDSFVILAHQRAKGGRPGVRITPWATRRPSSGLNYKSSAASI